MQKPQHPLSDEAPPLEVAPTLIPATVKSVSHGRVWVEVEGQASVSALVAVPAPYAPRAGDSVLVAPGRGGERYVVGVLVALREATPPLVLRDGTSAAVSEGAEGEVLSVRDASGRLVFEHHAAAHRSVVHATGNLELRADEGGILLSARDTVRVHSAREVRVESDHSVRLGTTPAGDRPASSLAMDARGTRLSTPHLEARADTARVELEEASLTARAISTTCETARHTVDVLEVQAGRILERAENVYRDVKELAQTRAGRVRVFAETTFHLFGRRTLFKAKEDLKLKADKIHLA
ncbi:DUF3540 domain-containing protein [Hyalangium sp.]|uniref:DUF3540 domain-containing protein n=1 Tax=Hyalangium sp. TaxID=2028555 RepID=UPI002D2CA38B|nr:DUF3540 domain-containing protein [Hyalangium sp.]HYH94571.1 DUF3540 domain-containing protein [Hyalangium sp.]